MVQLPPLLSLEVQPVFVEDNKDLAIRYVGTSIVASVAVGIGIAVWMRRRSAKQPNADAVNQSQAIAELNSVSTAGAIALEPDSTTPMEAVEADVPLVDHWLQHYTPLYMNTPGVEVDPEATSLTHTPPGSDEGVLASPTNALHQPIILTQAPATCRISIPQRQSTLLGIRLNGQYYSLFRSKKTQLEAQRLASWLATEGKPSVVTPIENAPIENDEYNVWVLQPYAAEESMNLINQPASPNPGSVL